MADAHVPSREVSRNRGTWAGDAGIGSPARTRRERKENERLVSARAGVQIPDDGGAVAPHRGGLGSASGDARALMHSFAKGY